MGEEDPGHYTKEVEIHTALCDEPYGSRPLLRGRWTTISDVERSRSSATAGPAACRYFSMAAPARVITSSYSSPGRISAITMLMPTESSCVVASSA